MLKAVYTPSKTRRECEWGGTNVAPTSTTHIWAFADICFLYLFLGLGSPLVPVEPFCWWFWHLGLGLAHVSSTALSGTALGTTGFLFPPAFINLHPVLRKNLLSYLCLCSRCGLVNFYLPCERKPEPEHCRRAGWGMDVLFLKLWEENC